MNQARVGWSAAAVLLVLLVGMVAVRSEPAPGATAAMRGEALARELGCFACHGEGGRHGIADPSSPSGVVPDWSPNTAKLYVSSEEDLRDWILLGYPRHQQWRKEYEKGERLVPMPGYADQLSPAQLDDLIAFFVAVSGWGREMPEEAYQGWLIAERLGCFGCHGPSGMGGARNPGSDLGYLPPWDGPEFAELVRDDRELGAWILMGGLVRLKSDPKARTSPAPKTPMPDYHDHLSDSELEKIVTYIRFLRREAEEETEAGAAEVIGLLVGPLFGS